VSGEVIVFAEDACHLVWGDAIGYVWGRQNERTEVPVANVKQRQNYYGVMNQPFKGEPQLIDLS
jgi:hypothetical protein